MRLDIFLPYLRKTRRAAGADSAPRPTWLARWLPSTWRSDLERARPGLIRRFLRGIGISWLSSPWRRVIQTTALLVFLWSFFVTCWPYATLPGQEWPEWMPIRFQAERQQITLRTSLPERSLPRLGATVFLETKPRGGHADHSVTQTPTSTATEPFYVVKRTGQQLLIAPRERLDDERWESLVLQSSPWNVREEPVGSWPRHYTRSLEDGERLPVEAFLWIDPLVSLSTAIAARAWVPALLWAGAILGVCLLIPRGFCGYLCPLGTTIDLFDALLGRRVRYWRVAENGWWVHIKYFVLLATLVSAGAGVLISGYVAAIPIITRACLLLGEPVQGLASRGAHTLPPMAWGHLVSIVMFGMILALGFLQPRFWCKYVCPSGALFSLGNVFRVSERKVESSCIHCNKCIEVCPFDAIKADYTTRTTDCTLCQTCGGVCPTHAIKFVERWNRVELKVLNDPPTQETAWGRRGFLSWSIGSTAGLLGGLGAAAGITAWSPRVAGSATSPPIRPPGSVPEPQFLDLCIRCGECFKVCPNHVLQPLSLQHGIDGLWTPHVDANWAGCEPSCQRCTQVCPTGAIRPLPLEEKREARMGLAIVDTQTCLPHAGVAACQWCVDECQRAGYAAIEFTRVHSRMSESGEPIEDSGFLAPVVLADRCVGCGLCQTRCVRDNVVSHLLNASAIVVFAGEGREDRLMEGVTEFPIDVETQFRGSYRQLHRNRSHAESVEPTSSPDASYLPDFLEHDLEGGDE